MNAPRLVLAASLAFGPFAPALPAAESAELPPALKARLASLEASYQSYAAKSVSAPYEQSVRTLNAKFIPFLERESAAAAKRKDLDALQVITTLIDGLKSGQPPLDSTVPVQIKSLWGTYRAEIAKLDAVRAASDAEARRRYEAGLKQIQDELTAGQQVAAALHVKALREALQHATSNTPASQAGKRVVASAANAQPPERSQGSPPPAVIGAASNLTGATNVKPFINSLGMKFVPVPGVNALFCIHHTRVKDYGTYAAETPNVDGSWLVEEREGIPVSNKDDEPVTAVNWHDAKAFCAWLSKKEGRSYRLPTDREWSLAVGIGHIERTTENSTPETLSKKIANVFPWGNQWPPPKGAGNYADTSSKEKFPSLPTIEGYTDGYATTAPVMSFKPNKFGLYDMGGNIWQWCEDKYNERTTWRVMRGAAWYYSRREQLFSSYRDQSDPGIRGGGHGFRIVVENAAP